jgi:hypothetical protein
MTANAAEMAESPRNPAARLASKAKIWTTPSAVSEKLMAEGLKDLVLDTGARTLAAPWKTTWWPAVPR